MNNIDHTTHVREHIDHSLIIPENMKEALSKVSEDPLIAEMIHAFLQPRNELIAQYILSDINTDIHSTSKTIEAYIQKTEQEEVVEQLIQAF